MEQEKKSKSTPATLQKTASTDQKQTKSDEKNATMSEQTIEKPKEMPNSIDDNAKAQSSNDKKEDQTMVTNAIVTVADVHTPNTEIKDGQKPEMPATKSQTTNVENANKSESIEKKDEPTKSDAQPTVSINGGKVEESKKEESKETTSRMEQRASIEKQSSQEKPSKGQPTNDSVEKVIDEKAQIEKTATEAKDSGKTQEMATDKKSDTVEIKIGDKSMAENDESKAADDTKNAQIDGQKNAQITDESKQQTSDPSKSFQVLPNGNQTSDKLNQETNDTGSLSPPKPPTETIRKTSFTVLKSDESIDDLLVGLEIDPNKENENNGIRDKPLTRPKSFKVLNAHDASGEDIILHQSSDRETVGNENDEDYLKMNADQRSGKYSDSELIKIDGQLNGRRKKYTKRAKSVKQLTIMDGTQSKDQDSGFEPSPRTTRSQKLSNTRTIYTAYLPERPRVGDIVDGRSVSSRYDQQRKPGDKNAVNMSTVSQTLQRNIRR